MKTKKLLSLVLLGILCSVGNVWGVDFTPSEIVATGGTTRGNVKCSSSATATTSAKIENESGTTVVQISTNADTDPNSNYIEIKADEGYTLTSVTINAQNNSSTDNVVIAALFWEGDYNGTSADDLKMITLKGNANATSLATVLSTSGSYRTIRLYKRINYNGGTIGSGASGSSYRNPSSSAVTFNVKNISASAEASGSGKTSLSASWSDAAPSFILGTIATLPTFSVTGGTKGADYSVAYAIQSGTLATVDSENGITAISTVLAGTATVRATVTILNTEDYQIAKNSFDCVISVTNELSGYPDANYLTLNGSFAQTGSVEFTKTDEKYTIQGNACKFHGNSFTQGLKQEGATRTYFTTIGTATITIVQPLSANGDKTILMSVGEGDFEELSTWSDCSVTSYPDNSDINYQKVKIYSIPNAEPGDYTIKQGSGQSYLAYVGITYTSMPITITSAGWASMYLDFPVVVPSGVTAYYASSDNISGSTVTLTSIEAGATIPANTGVVIKGSAGTYDFAHSAATPVSVSNNILTGTAVKISTPAGAYVLSGTTTSENCVFAPFSGDNLAAYKAYIAAGSVPSGAPGIRFIIEGENNATNIDNIEAKDKVVKFIENGRVLILRDGITYDALGRIVK